MWAVGYVRSKILESLLGDTQKDTADLQILVPEKDKGQVFHFYKIGPIRQENVHAQIDDGFGDE